MSIVETFLEFTLFHNYIGLILYMQKSILNPADHKKTANFFLLPKKIKREKKAPCKWSLLFFLLIASKGCKDKKPTNVHINKNSKS